MNEQLRKWLQLALTYGLGPTTVLKLIRHFGSVEAVLAQDLVSLEQVLRKGLALSVVKRTSAEAVARAEEWLAQAPTERAILTMQDASYPASLAEIAAPPLVLFAEGNLELLQNPKLAIVGTRHPSVQGGQNAYAFARELAENGLTVVSGLAAGIDGFAHEGALSAKAASTIAVLGTGIDIIYPASNRELYYRISREGLLLSEFNLAAPALSSNFPRRNRVVTGLSLGCLVVESALDGGSMISANLAGEMGREVFAIPGSIHNPMSRGCHKLIKDGAKLVETARDIFEELQLVVPDSKPQPSSPEHDQFLTLLGYEPQSLDVICRKLNLEFSEICGKLLELELAGLIVNCGNGRYQRVFK